jgi:hypothetical protein
MANCICRTPDAKYSLPLKEEAGKWVPVPICQKCRWALIKRAKDEGKFIRIFDLEASEKEAAKRNLKDTFYKSVLDAYATTERKKVSKPDPKVTRKS